MNFNTFKLLLEVRLADIAITKLDKEQNQEFKNKIISNTNREFESNTEFLEHYRSNNVLFRITYNHNNNHDLYNRTSLKNITEFNDIIIKFLNKLDYNKLITNKFDKYDIYVKNDDFHIIAVANVKNENLKLVDVLIITILHTNELNKNMIKLTV